MALCGDLDTAEHVFVDEMSLLDRLAEVFEDPRGDRDLFDGRVDRFEDRRLDDDVFADFFVDALGVGLCGGEVRLVVFLGDPDVGGAADERRTDVAEHAQVVVDKAGDVAVGHGDGVGKNPPQFIAVLQAAGRVRNRAWHRCILLAAGIRSSGLSTCSRNAFQ